MIGHEATGKPSTICVQLLYPVAHSLEAFSSYELDTNLIVKESKLRVFLVPNQGWIVEQVSSQLTEVPAARADPHPVFFGRLCWFLATALTFPFLLVCFVPLA